MNRPQVDHFPSGVLAYFPSGARTLSLPWRETTIEKPPWVTRIAFVGDSFTQGNFARDYTTGFVGIVDALLGSPRLEVVNSAWADTACTTFMRRLFRKSCGPIRI